MSKAYNIIANPFKITNTLKFAIINTKPISNSRLKWLMRMSLRTLINLTTIPRLTSVLNGCCA